MINYDNKLNYDIMITLIMTNTNYDNRLHFKPLITPDWVIFARTQGTLPMIKPMPVVLPSRLTVFGLLGLGLE